MIKCVCMVKCQPRNKHGIPQRYDPGDVDEFPECPTHFEPIEGEDKVDLDFATASEDMLNEMEFDLADLKAFIVKTYDQKPGNKGKDKTIAMLLDCRNRAADLTMV